MTAMDLAVTGELGQAHPLARHIGDFLHRPGQRRAPPVTRCGLTAAT